MPTLKRCKLGHSEDHESSPAARKTTTNGTSGYYPLNLLGFSCSPVKVEESRPPVVRTSRFNDSVIENWRKESKASNALDDNVEDEEKPSLKLNPKNVKKTNKKKNGKSNAERIRKYSSFYDDEDEEEEEEEEEEAFLVEQGFTEKLLADINMAAGNTAYDESLLRGVQETTTSNHDLDYQFVDQNISKRKKDSRACKGCGAELKIPKKMTVPSSGGHFLCKSCAKISKLKHVCGICKKWNQSESGSWVRCDGCRVWVHAECDEVNINCFKNLGSRTDYFCPPCKVKFNFEFSDSEKEQPKVKANKNEGQLVLPNKVSVLCNGAEGVYFPSLHSVVCKCGYCGTEKQALSEWERHTGSKYRNWRTSVRVKGSLLPLEQWMLQLAVS